MGCLKLNYNYETDLKISAVNNYVRLEKTTLKVHSKYLFGYTGHEKDNEIAGVGNYINMGARMLDTRLGRTTSPDPHAQKYPYISPFSYCLNSPIQAKDPDGKDVYLAVWFTSNGEVGHAAIAVDNYKAVTERVKVNGKMVTQTTMKPDGTVTYYDFWPGGEGAGKKNFSESQKGAIQSKSVTLDNLKNTDIGIGEKRPAEGLIRLKADYQSTQNVQKYAQTQYENQEANNVQYNGATQNCSNFALDCMSQLYSFRPTFGVENINTDGNKWLLIPSTNTNSVTPNFLFKSTSNLVKGSPNTGEVLNTDATKEGKDFVNEATNGYAEDKTPGK